MRLRLTAITALAYFVLGSAGLALAIPPGYASPVFPAAGFAVAMALQWGNRVLPGVWIGSLAINLAVAFKDGSLSWTSLLSAACVAFGAVAQAWCARKLVARRLGDRWRQLESENTVLQLLLFAGPLACVIAASVGVTVLYGRGIIDAYEVAFSWWNWWAGDTLGVLIFAPMTLIFLFRAAAPWKGRQLSVAVPTLTLLVLSGAAFVATSRWEHQYQMDEIATTATQLVQKLETRIVAHHEVLSSLRRLIEVIPDLDYGQFDYFTRLTLTDNRDIFALSINPYVAQEARAAFEAGMRRSTQFKDFRIAERNPDGKLVPASSRPNYVSVAFIAPLAGNASAVGYDIYSEPVRREAIDRAIRTRAPAATAPIRLVQENRQRVGQLVLHPAYRPHSAAASFTALPAAFAVGVIKIDEMIEIALSNRLPQGLVFNVSDPAAPHELRTLYRSHSENLAPPAGYLWHGAVTMSDRLWDVEVFPTQQYLSDHRPWGAWLVGMGGMLFAALLQLLIFGITGRTFAVQRRVEEQTREIHSKGEALQASLNEHDSLIQRIPVGVFKARFSAHGVAGLEYVSPLWCRQRGVDAAEVLLDPGLALRNIHSEDRSSLLAGINSAYEKGTPFAWQGRIVRDGVIGWVRVEASPTRLENGDLIWDGIQIDITSQKASEERQRLLSTAMSQSNAAIVVTDTSGNIAFVNDALVKTTGFSREEVIGHNPRIFKSGDTDLTVYRDLWRTIMSRQTWRGEIKNRNKSGELYWEFATISPVTDEGGNITHFIAIKENITERKRKDAELQRAKEAAEAAGIAKSRFLATMSHEIRTPMNGIIGLSQLALEKEVSAEGRSYLEKIYASSQSLLRILNDVLDYSKIESGHIALERAPFDLDDLLDRLRGLFTLTAEDNGLDFSIAVGSDVPRTLVGDSLRLQQVLSNLLGNAIKFTDVGRVQLTLSLVKRFPSQVVLRYVVQDSGIGMDATVRAELFQPFHQADSSVGRRFGGTGLGLAISRELLRLMGSEFSVESVPGEGSTFRFEMTFGVVSDSVLSGSESPKELGAPALSRVRRVALSRRLVGKRILVAEDNLINQQVVREFLKISGMDVTVANNGKLALKQLEDSRFDAVLMDLHMPEMDGLEATRQIRERPELADLPVLALTAAVTPDEQAAALACGMNGILAKPVDPDKLIRALLEWIPEDEAGAANTADAPNDRPPAYREPSSQTEEQLPSGPLFDFTNLLSLVDGNKGTVAALLRSFRDDMRPGIDDIASALASGDISGAKELSHRLKGASGNIGAVALYQAAEEMDRALGRGDAPTPLLATLRARFDETMAALADVRTGQPAKKIREEKVRDEKRLAETMEKLKQLLVSQQLAPDDLLEQLRTLVSEAHTDDFERLASCVENIDYPAALDIISRMTDAPGGS